MSNQIIDVAAYMSEVGQKARKASRLLASASAGEKNAALLAIAVDIDNNRDSLMTEKGYQEALVVLKELTDADLPFEMKNIVKRTRDDVLLAEARELEAQRLEKEQSQAMQWEAAVNALDSRRYDEAILYFKRLFDIVPDLGVGEGDTIITIDGRLPPGGPGKWFCGFKDYCFTLQQQICYVSIYICHSANV